MPQARQHRHRGIKTNNLCLAKRAFQLCAARSRAATQVEYPHRSAPVECSALQQAAANLLFQGSMVVVAIRNALKSVMNVLEIRQNRLIRGRCDFSHFIACNP